MSNANELLRRALEAWDLMARSGEAAKTFEEIRTFLAAEPEADEPTDILTIAYQLGYQEGKKSKPSPARKPMTEEEIDKVTSRFKDPRMAWGFIEGIRFAEKHHGIGGDDNG